MKFTFYYRESCHLCDSMRSALVAFNSKVAEIEWVEIDIDRSDSLVSRFDDKVPVLCFNEEEICHHFLDVRVLHQVVSNHLD